MNKEPTPWPPGIEAALVSVNRCRSLVYEASVRSATRRVIDELLASGKTPAEALEHLRNNPPFVDPNY